VSPPCLHRRYPDDGTRRHGPGHDPSPLCGLGLGPRLCLVLPAGYGTPPVGSFPARSITADHSLDHRRSLARRRVAGTTPGGATPGLPLAYLERPRATSPSQTTLDGILESGGMV
jgi:hypothetical protein